MCSAEKKWGRGWQQHCSTTASAEPFNKGPLDPHPSDTPPDNLEARQGGQVDWFWGVPGALHALSAPLTGQPVPAAPAPSDPHQQSHGCWGALHYGYCIGWDGLAQIAVCGGGTTRANRLMISLCRSSQRFGTATAIWMHI